MTMTKLTGGSAIAVGVIIGAALSLAGTLHAAEAIDDELMERFEYLSTNGNSNCSPQFADSIATMPPMASLQGSCCSPMEVHRYAEQIDGLRKYSDIAQIPPDPYDIPAGVAQELMAYYDIELSSAEQAAYDYAMPNSNEGGPCCCPCWRWDHYGGLAKYLLRERDFTAQQIAELWDISDGCGGGDGDHHHG